MLNINGNIIPEIPSREFFAKVEEKLDMWDCFSRGDGIELGRAATKYERNQIQKTLNELEDTVLFWSCQVCVELKIKDKFNFYQTFNL